MSKKPKILTKIEALTLENFFLESEVVLQEIKNSGLIELTLDLKKEVKRYETRDLDMDISLNRKHRKKLRGKKENLASQRKEVVETIKKRLKLDGAFGFNPDTLEVIPNKNKGE